MSLAVLAETGAPVIEAWQVVALLGSIALVVLGAYGTLILQNRSRGKEVHQRLFGTEGDETDEGFVQETEERLDGLAEGQERHAKETHTQLYRLDVKMSEVLEVVSEEHEDVRVPRAEATEEEGVPPPPGGYRYERRGPPGGTSYQADGASTEEEPPASD
jgi:hypothetical protein